MNMKGKRIRVLLAVVSFGFLLVVSGPTLQARGATEEPEVRHRIRIALPATEMETNHMWKGTGGNYQQHEPMLETLVFNHPETNERMPGLARRWESNDDLTEWTFYLQEGVPFHHGYGEFTARDVKHTYYLETRDDASPGKWAHANTDRMEIIDDYTVRIYCKRPVTEDELTYAFSQEMPGGTFYITSKAQWEDSGYEGMEQDIAGTGPFKFKERREGEYLLLERAWDEHWNGRDPEFDELQMLWAPEEATRYAMLLAGEADMAFIGRELVDESVAQGMSLVQAQVPNMQVAAMFTGNWFVTDGAYEAVSEEDNPTVNPKVRRALNHAVDRQEIIEVVYRDRAEELYLWGWRPLNIGWDPAFEERFDELYGYNPDLARELLAEAGYNEGELSLMIEQFPLPGQPEIPDLVDALYLYFEAVGIDVTIRDTESWGTFRERRDTGRSHGSIYIMRNTPIRTTEEFVTGIYSEAGWGFLYLDDWLEEARERLYATIDDNERDEIAREIGHYVYEKHTHIPIASTATEIAVNPEVVRGWTWPAQSPTITSHWYTLEVEF